MEDFRENYIDSAHMLPLQAGFGCARLALQIEGDLFFENCVS